MHEESSQGRTNSRDRGVVGGAGGQVDRVVGGAGGGDGGVVQVGGGRIITIFTEVIRPVETEIK